MTHFKLKRHLLCALLTLCAPIALQAEQFEIKDIEGFDRPLVAHTAEVPTGWQTSGRIAWNKPCSGNDLYETLFHTRSADGQNGARIMPGYQFFVDRAELAPGYPPDPMLNMMLAQSEATKREMASQFRGSNCAVGQLGGTQDALNRLILPNRPSGARVVRSTPNQAELNMMRQTFGSGMQGVAVSYDSQIVELAYVLNGTPTSERLYLSWFTISQQPFDMGGVIVSNSHTVVEPLRFVWSPSAQASQNLPRYEQIISGIKTNEEWRKKVQQVRDEINRKNEAARKERERASDERHKEFIAAIRGNMRAAKAEAGMILIPEQ